MRIRLSVSGKFIAILVSIVCFVNIGVGIIALKTATNVINKSSVTILNNVSENVANQLRDLNEKEFTFMEGLAAIPAICNPNIDIQEKCQILLSIAKRNPSKYQNIAFLDTEGNTYTDSGIKINLAAREYFSEAIKGKRYVADPTPNSVDNTVLQNFSVPVTSDGKIVGVLISMTKGNYLEIITNKIDVGNGMHPLVINRSTGEIVGNTEIRDEKNNTLDSKTSSSHVALALENAISGKTGVETFLNPNTGTKMIVGYRPIEGDANWTVFCAAPADVYRGMWHKLHANIVFTIFCSIALAIILSILLIKMIVGPLHHVKKSMIGVAEGNADLTQRIRQTSYDEIGELVEGFNTFTAKMQDIIKDIQQSNTYLSEVGEDLDASTEDTSNSIQQILGNINDVHKQIELQASSVQQTAGAVNEIASNIDSLEQMIEKQSAGVSDASSAVEQMIGNINSVNISVDKMASSFAELNSDAKSGSDVQHEVNQRIEEILNQSETLQEANIAIASIAEQTNLLAMNAAIEAAHAGEAGKGFSVVADEIRKLSETSGAQSKTIGEQLTSIQNSIQSVVEACSKSSQAFDSMAKRIQNTDDVVQQIKSAMKEQTQGSVQISQTLHIMNDSTLEVRTAGREMSSGNKAILAEIQNLQDATGIMRNSMENMTDSARKIDETGTALTDMSKKMRDSISKIGSQINQFKV